jgi:exonuclease III
MKDSNPPPPRLIISQNCHGLKSANRLDHCIAALSKRNADVLLLQEHGLHPKDKSRFTRICRRYGYLCFAAYLPTTRTRGGTAVLIKWTAFGLGPKHALVYKTFLNAGAVTVQLPAKEGDQPLSYASVYVPVRPPARRLFLRNLRAARLITRNTVVGADRNTVSDVSMDVRYPEGIDTQYSNAHAGLWDGMMAGVGLRDVFREVEGPQAKQYTRLGSSVHTRIDCLFAPCNSQELQWYTVTAVRLTNASWTSDHLALIAQAGQVPDKPDIGKGPKRINPDILLDDTLA